MVELSTFIQVVVNGILEGSIYALLGLGLTLVYGVLRIVNIAHGDLMTLAAFTSYWLFVLFGLDPFLSLAIVIPLFFAIGLLVQRFIVDPAISIERFHIEGSMLSTYGLALLVMSGSVIAWTPNFRSITTEYSYISFSISQLSINMPRLLTLLVTAVIAVVFYTILLRTDLGKAIRACVQDREAAMLMGIDFRRVASITFGVSTSVAAIAGTLWTLTHYLQPGMGFMLLMKAFIVVVFGGLGSVSGALLGGLIIGLAESTGSLLIAPAFKDAIGYAILVATLILKPSGILGKMVR